MTNDITTLLTSLEVRISDLRDALRSGDGDEAWAEAQTIEEIATDIQKAIEQMQESRKKGVHAFHINHGRVWVESIDKVGGTARVRYDAGDGIRSREYVAPLSEIDFNREWMH